jgi:hypothetical protein
MSAFIAPVIVAVVSFLAVALGWFVTHRQNIGREASRRQERIKDVQTALRAEMRSHWRRLGPIDLEARAELIVAKIRDAAEKGQDFTPFIPREDHSVIFSAVAHEIHILPNDVIDPVVLYYTHANAISQFVDDLRADKFAALDPSRKIEMYRDYIGMKEQARELAEEAIRAIDVSLSAGGDQ